MATYIMANPAIIVEFNRSLMRLLYPDHLRDDNYVTDFVYPVITHPVSGYSALVVPDNYKKFHIHPQADGARLLAVLDIFVADQGMTQQEADDLFNLIISSRDSQTQMDILENIPLSWEPYVLTQAEAEATGWLTYEEESD